MALKLISKILQLGKEENGKTDSFVVLMTALSVILLAFFVLLNSLATIDNDKTKKAMKSIKGSFGVLPNDLKSLIGIKPRVSPDMEVLGIPELALRLLSRELEELILEEDMGKDFGLFSSKQSTIISFSEKVSFRSSKAELEPAMFPVLDKVAAIIKKSGMVVHVKGHTDNAPMNTGKYQSNWELSIARAVNTLKYLVEKGRVDSSKIAVTGLAESRPLFANDTSLNRSRNRRVEIVLLENKKEL